MHDNLCKKYTIHHSKREWSKSTGECEREREKAREGRRNDGNAMMDEFRAYSAATDGVFTLPTEGAGQVLMEWYD